MTKQSTAFWRSLNQWLTRQWGLSASAPEVDEDWAVLPAGIAQTLTQKLQSLPSPMPYQEAVHVSTRDALDAWRANPETATNSLVVLASPVEAIGLILKESLQGYLLDCDVQFFFGGYHRPPNPLAITGHLQRELEPKQNETSSQPETPVTQAEIRKLRPRVNVIPSLEPCFLRCIQGWEGIEYLQNLVTQDPSQFWVFGCNHWAWAFLDKVCQISAYLEQTMVLPELSGDDLSQWLRPLLNVPIPSEGTEVELQIATDTSAWESLSRLASGNGTMAAYLWLQSLRLEAKQLSSSGTLPPDTGVVDIATPQPLLPGFMSLEVLDRYLLHALLIHGTMTRSHLALSMGENERMIRSRVQVLRREGLIRQNGRWLTVHPAQYPKLRSELANNNFLIGQA